MKRNVIDLVRDYIWTNTMIIQLVARPVVFTSRRKSHT